MQTPLIHGRFVIGRSFNLSLAGHDFELYLQIIAGLRERLERHPFAAAKDTAEDATRAER